MSSDTNFKLGILGLGRRSTDFYIEQILQESKASGNGILEEEILRISTEFAFINANLPANYEILEVLILSYLFEFADERITNVVLPNITLHDTVDRLSAKLPTSQHIVHPITLAVHELESGKYASAVLFSSRHMMVAGSYQQAALSAAKEIQFPKPEDAEFLDELRQKVYDLKETQKEVEQFNKLVKDYASKGTVVIACTELSVVLDAEEENIIDLARLQIRNVIGLTKDAVAS